MSSKTSHYAFTHKTHEISRRKLVADLVAQVEYSVSLKNLFGILQQVLCVDRPEVSLLGHAV